MTRISPIFILLFFLSCTNDHPGGSNAAEPPAILPSWNVPAPGTLIAADSVKATDAAPNDFYFSVKLTVPDIATAAGTHGPVYDLHAAYGLAEANGVVVMPVGGEHLQPLLRRQDEHNFIIGFIPGKDYGGDSSFHEYYRVTGSRRDIQIVPLKGFSIR